MHFADGAALDEFLNFFVVWFGAMLHTGLDYALVAPRRLDHRAPFADRESQRLLDIDILARLAGEHSRDRVPVIGRGNQDSVEVLLFQQLPEILVGLAISAGPFFGSGGAGRIHVADGGELDIGHVPHESGYRHTPTAAADQADADPVIRAEHAFS